MYIKDESEACSVQKNDQICVERWGDSNLPHMKHHISTLFSTWFL